MIIGPRGLIGLGQPKSLSLFGKSGSGDSSPPLPASSQWWTPGVYYQADPVNGRHILNGIEYPTVAAMVTAGVATNVTGGGYNISVPANTQITVVADAITSGSTPSALEYIVSFDDGGASLTDDFFYIGRTTGNAMQSGITAASTSVGTLSLGSAPVSTNVRIAGRWKSTAYVASGSGVNGVTNTGAAYPTIGRLTIGNRYDGLRPWNGTINGVSVFLTREFTKEQCELVSGIGLLRGLVWSWWNKQLSFTEGGKTHLVAYNTRDKRQYAVVIDSATRKVIDFKALTEANVIPQDDHSTGAFPGQILPNGQLCQINGGHDNEAFMRFQRSTNDMPGNLGETIQIPLGYASTVSYAQLFLNGTDLFVICQTRGNVYWDIFKSTDYGNTWARLKTLVHGTATGGGGANQWYISASNVNSGIITFYTQEHPSNAQNQIRRFNLNLTTGDLSISGAVVGSIYAGTNDVAITEISACELVRTPDTGHSQRLLAVRGDGLAIAIADTADAFVTCDYRLGLDSGSSWSFNTVTNGSSFSATNNPSYVGGMIFAEHAHTGHLLYTADTSTGNWLLRQMASTDGVTFTPTTILNNAAVKTMRPICPKGATSSLAVMVQSATTYNDFNDMVVDGRVYAAV